jgi:beta-phosphoglucomutase
MIKAILFDLDGVLLDSPDWHYRALNKALGLFGWSVDYDYHTEHLNGLPTKAKLEHLIKIGVDPSIASFVSEMKQKYTLEIIRREVHEDYQKTILLKALNKKYRLACVSNAVQETCNEVLGRMNIIKYFTPIVTNEHVANPKPSPDGYLYALERLGLTPDVCVAIEDAPRGQIAAEQSGVRVIKVNNATQVNYALFQELGLL